MELFVEIAVGISVLGLIIAAIALLRSGSKVVPGALTQDQYSLLLRTETDRIRQFTEEHARGLRQELGENIRGFQSKLDQDITRMGEEAGRNRDALRDTIEKKLDAASSNQISTAQNLREEITGSFTQLSGSIAETLTQSGQYQKERLDNVSVAITALTETQGKAQESLRQTVESRLDLIRTENAAKLDEMRKTVDEKLQATLETRLGESFNRVVEHLERVHKGIGEMQQLAAGVGDLKKLFSNVKARGTFGEVQLGVLIEQFLTPDQYLKNVKIKQGTSEQVEFAIRLPGRNSDGEVLLPVDAKFPHEDFERLITASENGDAEGVAEAAKALENTVKSCAKTIRDKYIDPPGTTDFGILFLPTESLYAEVLRRPGLLQQIQRDYHVTLAGPTTFAAILNALHMGFRSLAIEKRSSEVWQILGAVQNEFGKYNKVVETLSRQLDSAATSVKNLGVRTKVMSRKLQDVQTLPDETASLLLGTEFKKGIETEEDEDARPPSPEDLSL